MKKDSLMTKQQLIAEEQKRLFKNRKVVQLNKFIKGDVSPFTVNDLKIFKLIISKVDSKDSLFQDFYEITTKCIGCDGCVSVNWHVLFCNGYRI